MTATTVNGVPVIASEGAHSAWRNSATGEPLAFKRILRLLLADGSEVFGCLHCDYTADSPNKVRSHLNKHRAEKERSTAATLDRTSIAELARALTEHERVITERDDWKRRALQAEGSLRRLRKIVGGDQ